VICTIIVPFLKLCGRQHPDSEMVKRMLILTWSVDLRRTVGRSWMRVAEDRARWREIVVAYVPQWAVVG
jgi:steroid 5-alpha reductase family enzyme